MRPLPSGAWAVTGSSRSFTANTRITTMLQTNSGTTVADRPPTVTSRSSGRPSASPATTPPRTPSGTTSTNATSASFSELSSAGPSSDDTGTRNESDSPSRPRAALDSQCQYCSGIGWSVPSSWFSALTAPGAANGPRMRRPTSPGSTCAPRKTMVASSHSVSSARPKRRSRNRATMPRPPPLRREPCLEHADVPHGGGLHVGDVGLGGGQVRVEVRENDRGLVQQQGLDLLVDGALRAQVDRGHVLLDQPVVLGVVEVGRVPGPLGSERGTEEHVRDAAVAVVGDPHGRVEPGRLAEHRVAVVGPRRGDAQVDGAADLLDRRLDRLRQQGDLVAV